MSDSPATAAGAPSPANRNRNNNNFRNRNRQNTGTTRPNFKGPIPEIANDTFDIGSATDSTFNFKRVVKNIELYVQRTCKDSYDIVVAMRTLTRATLTHNEPPDPTDPQYQVLYFKWTKGYDAMEKRIHTYKAINSTV